MYKYDTNIKPSEIFIGSIGEKPELAKALGIPEQYWNMNYHRFLIETKDTYRKVLTDNIETFKQYGIKALGRYGGTSGPKSFEIIPLITNEDNLGVKAVAELEPIKGIGKGGADNWKIKEVLSDTPTNVVDEGRLVWGSEEFIDAILDDMRASAQLFEFDMEGDLGYLKRNQPEVAKQIIQGKINIANHVDFIDVARETLDRTDLPPNLDKAKATDRILDYIIRTQELYSSTNPGQPELGVTDTQAQDPEFKKIFTERFVGDWDSPDTPTNVVDDVPTLNTDLVWEKEKIDVDTNPKWKDDVIPKNNIFNPTMEYEELSDIVPRILNGTASDVEFARFGIYLLHNSPQPAFGPRGMSDPDMIADVVKIVIFNGKTFQYAINPKIIDNVYGRAELKSGGLPNELTKEVMLQFANEEGVFANAKQRIKQTIINEHNKLYANADDYFILFRSGDLTNDSIQSFSKNGRQAYFIGFLTGQETSKRGGRGVDAYFVNKNDFIDLQALGLDYGSEAEVIVFKQAVDNPYSKAVIVPGEDFNHLSKERVEFLKNNWVMMQDEFPKTGFINSIKPDDPTRNQTLRVMDDTPGATTASTRVQQVAFDFAKTYGLAEPNFNAIAYFNPEVGLEAADIYEGLPDFDDSAVPLYNKFIKETNAQYDALINAGIQFELVDTDPYTPNAAGHKQMINDMQNGRLKVLATSSAGELPQGSPMGQVSKYTDVNGRQMLENDVFRAVHDTFGHGMRGNTFGPIGEYNAWLAHKEMYTPTSQRVMTTETLGQNTYVNFGPHMRTEEGALIGKGDTGYISPQDRPFAPQKVAVMPDDIITKAGDVVTDATGLVNTNAMTKVRNFISNTPDAAESLWKATKFTLGKAFRGLQIFDPGDIAIEYGLARLLPRLGLGAIAAPALYAYVFYELSVLAVDAANGLQKAAEKQGVAGIGEDKDIDWKQLGKDTWSEMGEVSDTWSLSWKISEPIINKVFEEYGKMKVAKDEKDYFSNLETGLAPR